MKKIIKSFAAILTILLVMNESAGAFCGFGSAFASTPVGPNCSCTLSRVAVKRMSGISCLEARCIFPSQVQSYLNQGWTYGCCAVARMDGSQQAGEISLNVSPNPASSTATISFTLGSEQKVSLRVFDMHGRLVSILADGVFAEGENKFNSNMEKVEAGIYSLRMEMETGVESRKLTVTK